MFPPGPRGLLNYSMREQSMFDLVLRITAHEQLDGNDEQSQLALEASCAFVSVYVDTELEVQNVQDFLRTDYPGWPTLAVSTNANITSLINIHNHITRLCWMLITTPTLRRAISAPRREAVQMELMGLQAEIRHCRCMIASSAYAAHVTALQRRARKLFPLQTRGLLRTTVV